MRKLSLVAQGALTNQTTTRTSNLKIESEISGRAPEFGCRECSDVSYVVIPGKGARPCVCKQKRIVDRALAQIPPEMKITSLAELKPRYDLVPNPAKARAVGEVQKAAIDEMGRNPFQSFLFVGDNGAGKTHLAYTLYAHAVANQRRAVACSTRDLLDDFKRYELGESGENGQRFYPRVSASELQTNSEKWTILLDEFEKCRVTEFTSEMLFNLLDSVWKFNHQIIVTSNLDEDALIARWSKIDDVYGRSIAKRLAASCTVIGLFF